MPLSAAGLKAKMKDRIYNGLKAQFSGDAGTGVNYTPVADAQWQKMAEAISGIAADIVMAITTEAIVNPGIPTAGGPTNQATVAPGTIS